MPSARGQVHADPVVGPQIHLFVFDGAPQSFDEDSVAPGALAIHADGDVGADQRARERLAGEPCSAI